MWRRHSTGAARLAVAAGSLAQRVSADGVHSYRGEPFGALGLPSSVVAYIGEHGRTRGDAPYITAIAADGEASELTYGALDLLTGGVAGWVARNHPAGAVLALAPVNDLRSVVAILGVLRSGRALLLVNPSDPAARVREQAAKLDATLIDAADVPWNEDPSWQDGPIDPGSDALFFGTSGSTASSKLVAQMHANAVSNAHALRGHHGLGDGERMLGCLPIHHVNGLHFTILATLVAGAHAILAHGFEALGYPDLVRRYRPRLASVVPTILEVLGSTWRGDPPPRELRYFVSAAAPLTARTARAFVDRLGVRVIQGYGLTETTNFSTTMPADLPESAYRRLVLDAPIPSVGVALDGNEVAVLGADGEAVTPGEPGEVCMRGHNVMSRYAANAEATEEAFRGGWFHSGDIGRAVRDEETGHTFFVLTGRLKNIAKVSGESVSLEEMERVLRAVPQVADAACVALPHRLTGEQIVAAVVMRDGAAEVDLRGHLGATFAQAALPRRIVSVDSLPRTATGKIRRRELAATVASLVGAR
jgi:acyl-CoA synthetase (AMP-forming)/AMP-acid ligase II